MGACASFPKGMKKEAREAPPPEQPKEELAPTAPVAEGEKEIKVDDKAKEEDEKTLGTFFKEEKTPPTTVTEEENTSKIEEPIKDSPAVIEEKAKSSLPISDEKVESYNAPIAPVTSDVDNEITEVKDEKK